MPGPRIRDNVACPSCGCGLIDGKAPDVWQKEHGGKLKEGDTVELVCPECGQKHSVVVEGED
jgi:RNase P subunit RPR2